MAEQDAHTESESTSLLDELRQRQRDLVRTLGPAGVVTLIGFVVAFFFVEPAPPRRVVIATGAERGDYFATAAAYTELFARNGITLEIRATAGTIENYRLLQEGEVNLAIVQSGVASTLPSSENLESLASLYLEPVWIFHSDSFQPRRLGDFEGKRIAIGVDGSGAQSLAKLLFRDNGVEGGASETVFINAGGQEAVSKLNAGEVDAIFLLLSPNAPLIHELLRDKTLQLFDFERSGAYARRYQFLRSVELEPGVIDLQANLPRQRVQLIAPYANLVAASELHDAFIPLLLEAATETHSAGGLLVDAGELPSLDGAEFEVSEVAREYVVHGPSFFQRHLSFWVASLIDRAKIMVIPLIALFIPLIKLAPPVYRWRIRSRIYRWYAILRGLDQRLRDDDASDLAKFEGQLDEMEKELGDITVPLSYMQEFYDLRVHIDLIKRRVTQSRMDEEETPEA